MEICEISTNERTGEITVTAIVENKKLVRLANWNEPAEYTSCVCITSFFLEDIDFDLNDINALENYLENVEWDILIDDDF
jgi:hypothetical protein